MKIVAVDWDQTLVDTDTQEWLPGALDFLRWLRKNKHIVLIHSVRAERQYGRDQIESKLRKHKLNFEVLAKPYADLYVDDKAALPDFTEVIKKVRASAT